MKLKALFSSLLTLVMIITGYAQKIKVESGNFDFLKGVKEINVQFDFSNVSFFNDKLTENQYIDKKQAGISKDKGQNEATIWLEDWNYTKEKSIPSKFLASANKYSLKSGISYSQDNTTAKYLLIVETIWIYPGWFAGVMKQPSKVSTLLKFIEVANPSNILLTISCDKAYGDVGFVGVANTNDRIAEGYAKTSKEVMQLLDKKIK